MNARLKKNWRLWLLLFGLILSLGIAVIFSLRAIRAMINMRAGEQIRPWMTLPYIAHAHHVPEIILYQAIRIPFRAHDRRPVIRIARLEGVPVQTMIAELQAAIQQYRGSVTPGAPTPTQSTPLPVRISP